MRNSVTNKTDIMDDFLNSLLLETIRIALSLDCPPGMRSQTLAVFFFLGGGGGRGCAMDNAFPLQLLGPKFDSLSHILPRQNIKVGRGSL